MSNLNLVDVNQVLGPFLFKKKCVYYKIVIRILCHFLFEFLFTDLTRHCKPSYKLVWDSFIEFTSSHMNSTEDVDLSKTPVSQTISIFCVWKFVSTDFWIYIVSLTLMYLYDLCVVFFILFCWIRDTLKFQMC